MKKLLIFLSGVIVGVLGMSIYKLFDRPIEPAPPIETSINIKCDFTEEELKQFADGLNPNFVGKGYDFEEVIVPLASRTIAGIKELTKKA